MDLPSQELSRGGKELILSETRAGVDVHALAELNNAKVPKTDETPKYDYKVTSGDMKSADAKYGEVLLYLSRDHFFLQH